jgi:malic enzyme
MYTKTIASGFALCATLAACGDTTGEQLVYGAGAGAAGAAILDGNVAAGAAVGAAANVIYCKENPGPC